MFAVAAAVRMKLARGRQVDRADVAALTDTSAR